MQSNKQSYPDFYKLPFEFDTAKLKADLELVREQEWHSHYNDADYDGTWEVAALRSVLGSPDVIYSSALPDIFQNTPLLDRCTYIPEIINIFQCNKTAIRFMKLAPGSAIKPHADSALSIKDGEARIHVPVTTNPQLEFYLDGERLVLNEGECWYLDFTLEHSVKNLGTTPRTHLVMDCKVNDWLMDVLDSSTIPERS